MPRKYPVEVRVFAVQKKKQGHSWDKVRELMRQEFKIEPPTARQMGKWLKTTTADSIAHLVAKEIIRKQAPGVQKFRKDLRESEAFEDLIVSHIMGGDLNALMMSYSMKILEDTMGTENFLRELRAYAIEKLGVPGWNYEVQSEQKGDKDEGSHPATEQR